MKSNIVKQTWKRNLGITAGGGQAFQYKDIQEPVTLSFTISTPATELEGPDLDGILATKHSQLPRAKILTILSSLLFSVVIMLFIL
ncbi:hypothetical protein RU639_010471 [Aspergillus parasiticus]